MKISAIVPCYNEEKYVGDVLTSLLKSLDLFEVIAINDGSTDNSLEVLSSFGQKITLINFKKNKGKAAAVVAGIKAARGDLILMVDSDLIGLTPRHLKKMFSCLEKEKAGFVLGDLHSYSYSKEGENKFLYWEVVNHIYHRFLKYDPLTGERLYYKKDLLPYLKQMEKLGYGLEVFLNYQFKKKKMAVVHLKNVSQPPKEEKGGFTYLTFRRYFKEGLEISRELGRQRRIKNHEVLLKFEKEYLRKFMKNYVNSSAKWRKLLRQYLEEFLDFWEIK